MVVAYRLLWTSIRPKSEQRLSEIGLNSNEIAANGPLPGEVSLYDKELRCCQGLPTPGYYPSLNAAEIADGQRSRLFPCDTFTGSFVGPISFSPGGARTSTRPRPTLTTANPESVHRRSHQSPTQGAGTAGSLRRQGRCHHRSQAQAISMARVRTRRLPALLIPCSRSLLPLS